MKIPFFLTLLLIALAPVTFCQTPSKGALSKVQTSVSPDDPVTPGNLREHLWSRVKKCRSMQEDSSSDDTEGKLNIIDDIANGYLQVSAGWPPCGCRCGVTVAAFKSSDGTYTILQTEDWGCTWTHSVSAYPPLHVIFPEDLNIRAFIPSAEGLTGSSTGNPAADSKSGSSKTGSGNAEDNHALFYLDVELPRIGTDVKLTIRTIPLGMRIDNKGLLAYGYAEAEDTSNCTMLFRIREIVEQLNDAHLESVIHGQMELLPPEAKSAVKSAIGDDPSRFKSIEDLRGHLRRLHHIYELYSRIEHQWVILAWEREKSTFFIRDKGPAMPKISFREFLLRDQYWSPAC